MKFLAIFMVFFLLSEINGSNSKIGLNLAKSIQEDPLGQFDLLVSMKGGTGNILKHLKKTLPKGISNGQKSQIVYNALKSHSDKSQASALEFLKTKSDLKIKSLWINNMIFIGGASSQIVKDLAQIDEIDEINLDERIQLIDGKFVGEEANPNPRYLTWNVERIRAHDVWDLEGGNSGDGVIIGAIDTGARATHEILMPNYLGDDNYGWFDPYNGSTSISDPHGHGSHAIGVSTGVNGFGVAPSSKWTMCKGIEEDGTGTNSGLIQCGQFMICPTDVNGENPDCSKAPHIVQNGWGASQGATFFDSVIEAFHVAGIFPVFGMGGSGNTCGSVGSPADSEAGVFAVGATTDANCVLPASGRGPSIFGELKPDICAPGQGITSATNLSDDKYSSFSGASTSVPHLAGLLALIKSADPNVTYDEAKEIVHSSSRKVLCSSGQVCGDTVDNDWPNNFCGHGILDCLAAIQQIIGKK